MKHKGRTTQKNGIGLRGAPSAKRAVSRGACRTGTPIESRFQAVFESSRDAIGVSKAGIHVFVNPAYLELFGFPPDADLAGKPILDLIAPESRDHIKEYILRREKGDALPSTYMTRGMRSNGAVFDMEVNVSLYQENGEDHTLVILRDVTERKRADEEIAERGALLQQIMDTASVAIFLVDRSGRITHANRRMAEMFGWALKELVGCEYVELVHPFERESGRNTMLALLASEIPSVDLERLYWRKDSNQFWAHLVGRRFHDVHGSELGLIGVITDISLRKQMEEKLQASEELFRRTFEDSPVGVAIVTPDMRFQSVNKRLCDFTGYPEAELAGKHFADITHPDDVEEDVSQTPNVLAGETDHFHQEKRYLRKDGTTVWARTSVRLIRDEKDNPLYFLTVIEDITAQMQSELALKLSEEKYRRFYNDTPVLLHSIDRNGIVVEVNDYWLKTMGYERDEVIGKKVTDFYTAASRKYAQEVTQPIFFRDGIVKDISYQFVRKNGDVLDMLLSATAERDAAGIVVRSLAVTQDITERKRMEESLSKSEKMLQTIIDAEPECVKVLDENANLIMMNRAGLNMIQADSLGQVKGECICPFVTSEYRPAFMDLTRRVFQGDSGTLLFEIVGLRGRHLWLETHAVPLRNEKNEITALLGVTRDITERKRIEEELREKEGKYRALFESANDGIFINDDNSFIDCNQKGAEMYGLTKEEIIGRSPTEFAPERQPDGRLSLEVAAEKTQAALNGVPQVFEWRPMRADGGLIDVEITLSRLDLGGKMCLQAIVRDISDRKRAEQALRENQARLDLALQSAHMGVWRWEIRENRRYFDDLTCQLLGIEAAKFTGAAEEFFQAVHPEDREKVKAALARTIERDVLYELAYRIVWPDGSIHYITARGRLFRDDKGQPARINGILWDITETKRLEQEMLRAQKLESIGTLAGGIAHDFNNLLQGVFGYISMAKLSFDQKERSLAMLAQAEKALHQSVNLTTQLLTFSKGGKPVKKVLDLRSVLDNSVAFALSGSRITYEIVIDEDVYAIEADEGQLGQVIQNVVLNADQAMPLGGMIRISVRNTPAAAIVPDVNLQSDLVEISIRDQGTGIPAEYLSRIFDPYFTTKEKGSGLGLATSYSIIKNHGGLIRVQSEVGKGTKFSIYLPASSAEGGEGDRPAIPASIRNGRILVMDDEEMIRAVAREMLTAIGHDAAFAETGEAALEAYRTARDAGHPFDVVILDLTIRGGMGGMETLRKLMEIDPEVKAVVSSGYSDDASLSNYRGQGFRSFLKKPYNIKELQSTLDTLLA